MCTFYNYPNKNCYTSIISISQEEKEFGTSTQKTLEAKQFLLESGANQQIINAAHGEFLGSGFWKLFGRALARSSFEKETATIWSFLPKTDFEKINESEESLSAILEEMRSLRPESNFFALLWESSLISAPKSINALLASNDALKLKMLAEFMHTFPTSSYFFAKGFATFSEAELKIRGFIRKVL